MGKIQPLFWLTSCKSVELVSREKFVRREPGRDGKILSGHRQDGNVEAHPVLVRRKKKRIYFRCTFMFHLPYWYFTRQGITMIRLDTRRIKCTDSLLLCHVFCAVALFLSLYGKYVIRYFSFRIVFFYLVSGRLDFLHQLN